MDRHIQIMETLSSIETLPCGTGVTRQIDKRYR
jgi:hypothetical protein